MDSKKLAQFMEYVAKLDVMEFVGLAKLLKVDLAEEDDPDTMRAFDEILQDMFRNYCNTSRSRRREISRILHKATKGKSIYKSLVSESTPRED